MVNKHIIVHGIFLRENDLIFAWDSHYFCPKLSWIQPCNPAVGGPAKSQLVHEVDALGGEMGKVADR